MTMIIGIAVKPKGKRKPFFLIGSDSRLINVIDILDGESIYETYEDSEKIFSFGDKLIGMAGANPEFIFEDLLSFLKSNLSNMEETCENAIDFIKDYLTITELPPGQSYWRVTAIIGSMEKGFPQIATLECDTRDLSNAGYRLSSQTEYGFHPEFIGGVCKTRGLQANFIEENKIKNKNLTYFELKKYAEKYLSEAVKLYPEICNSKFQFKTLPNKI